MSLKKSVSATVAFGSVTNSMVSMLTSDKLYTQLAIYNGCDTAIRFTTGASTETGMLLNPGDTYIEDVPQGAVSKLWIKYNSVAPTSGNVEATFRLRPEAAI